MKIALLTDGVHPYVIGGMQRHSAYLAKFLSEKGHSITLVHCVKWDAKEIPNTSEVRQSLGIAEHASFESIVIRFPKSGFIPGHYLKESYLYSKMIYDRLQDKLSGFDFIYAKGFSAWHLLHLKSKGQILPPIGVKFHGYEMFQKNADLKSRLKSWMLRGAVRWNNVNADVVFSYGGHISELIENLGIPREKILEITSGIDGNWIHEKVRKTGSQSRKFLFVGRNERRKGIEELHHAIRLLTEGNWEFHFIGPIPQNARINQQNVMYHGSINDTAMMQQKMDEVDILVVPSYSEGMPNVILEGMARGLAIVASDVGAVNLQVDKENGWLIEPGNQSELLNTLLKCCTMEEELLQKMQQNSVNRIREKFLWPDVIARLERAIEGIIHKP